MSHASARTAQARRTAEDLAFPVRRGGNAGGPAAAVATLMALCATFAMVVVNLPHPGF